MITALALPTSVVATFFFMYIAGFTFNMMSLMALSLVIGILIDDAVVVRENIFRHMEMGKDPMQAARDGTAEIGLAVMATTFTILAVFLPVGFMTGIVGQFFKQFALTIAFAVAMSLLVAFTLDPMLSSRFVRFIPPEERRRTRVGRILEGWGAFYDRIDQRYHRLLGWAVDHPWSVVAVAVVVFVSSLSTLAVLGTEFVPAEDRGQMEVLVELPPGTSFEQSEVAVANVETIVRGMPEVRQIFSTVGVNGDVLKARLQVKLTSKLERERGLQAIKAEARQKLAAVPLIKATVTDPEFMQGAPSEAPVNIFVRGDDMAALHPAERRDRRQGPAGAVAPPTSTARSRAASPRWSRRSIARWPPTSASRWRRWPPSCAAWSRAWSRPSCATARRNTTSGCGWRRSSATISPPSPARRSTRRAGPRCAPATSCGWSPGSARPTSSASSGGARPRSASSSTTGRSATSPPTSRR